jgi:hypothetical protein
MRVDFVYIHTKPFNMFLFVFLNFRWIICFEALLFRTFLLIIIFSKLNAINARFFFFFFVYIYLGR